MYFIFDCDQIWHCEMWDFIVEKPNKCAEVRESVSRSTFWATSIAVIIVFYDPIVSNKKMKKSLL